MRATIWGLALGCGLWVAGCSSSDDDGQTNNPINMTAGAGAGGTGGVSGAAGTAGAAGSTSGTGGMGALAGTGGVGGAPGAGGTSAGTGSMDLDAGLAPDAEVDGGDEPDAGPTEPEPVDYGARGPYEVVVEKNVGGTFRNNVADDTALCRSFIALVGGSNPEVDAQLTTYPADMDRGLYTMFRPAELAEGKKYPVLTWGNGTCSQPFLFQELLEHVASHGFIIIASNSRWVSGGVEMLRGLDFVVAENARADSPLYGKVDTKMLGVFGHSQGSMATVTAAADPRVVASVPIEGASATEIRNVKGPVFLIAGELDTLVDPSGVKAAFDAATIPAVYGLSMGQDHLMPGLDPSPILDAVTAWFKIHLAGDDEARKLFYGDDCSLCSDPRWTLERKNL